MNQEYLYQLKLICQVLDISLNGTDQLLMEFGFCLKEWNAIGCGYFEEWKYFNMMWLKTLSLIFWIKIFFYPNITSYLLFSIKICSLTFSKILFISYFCIIFLSETLPKKIIIIFFLTFLQSHSLSSKYRSVRIKFLI